MRRGAILIFGAMIGASIPGAAEADDRLVEACEYALQVHARNLRLDFPQGERVDEEVRVTFSFANAGENHIGHAVCTFRMDTPLAAPSLARFEVMGRGNASLFLVAQHAIRTYLNGGRAASSATGPAEAPEADEPEPNKEKRRSKRRMHAAAPAVPTGA